MDHIIKQISDIEAATTSVTEDTNSRKKAFALEMEKKTAAFDKAMDERTEKEIGDLQQKMDAEMNHQLEQQRIQAAQVLTQMEDNYNQYHTEYATQLFLSFVKE